MKLALTGLLALWAASAGAQEFSSSLRQPLEDLRANFAHLKAAQATVHTSAPESVPLQLDLGAVPKTDRERFSAAYARIIERLGVSPMAQELLRQWHAQPSPKIYVVEPHPGGGAHGHAWPPERIKISEKSLENANFGAAVIVHEWLGHGLTDGQLQAVTGQVYHGLSTEMVSRSRGWRVWLELDPASALADEEFKKFLELGPATYWASLREPTLSSYFLSLDLDELADARPILLARARILDAYDDPFSKKIAEVARKLADDPAIMEKYKRVSGDPRVRALVAAWEEESEQLRRLGEQSRDRRR